MSGFQTIVDILKERGANLGFKDVPVHISNFPRAVIDMANAMKQSRPDDLIVDLSEAATLLALEIYAAATVYASMADIRQRERIRVRCRPPGATENVDVFLPIFSVSRLLPLLKELDRHPDAKLSKLQQVLDRHVSTISRQTKRAERAGLLYRADDGYKKTEFGKVVLRVFADRK